MVECYCTKWQAVLFEGHSGCPFWWTFRFPFSWAFRFSFWGTFVLFFLRDIRFRLSFFRDIHVVLFEGYSGCPIWGTFMLYSLRDIQVVIFKGHSGCPFWGTFILSFLRDIQVVLFEGHSGCPFWWAFRLFSSRDIQVVLFEGIQVSFWYEHSWTSRHPSLPPKIILFETWETLKV